MTDDKRNMIHMAWLLTQQVEQEARRLAIMLNSVETVGDVLESKEGQYGFHVTEQEFAETAVDYLNMARSHINGLEAILQDITPYTGNYVNKAIDK